MKVSGELPARLWWHLARRAEAAGTTVFKLMAECTVQQLGLRAQAPAPAVEEPAAVEAPPVVERPEPAPNRWRVKRGADGWLVFAPGSHEGEQVATQTEAFALVQQRVAPRPKRVAKASAPTGKRPRQYVRWTADMDQRMRELNAQGETDAAIARLLGASAASVSLKRMAAGLEKNYQRKTTKEKSA